MAATKPLPLQSIYLFNGMVPAKGSPLNTILQPVLEWGEIGLCWSVASWINPDSTNNSHSCPPSYIRVKPGDVLVGVIRLVDEHDWLLTYFCEFEGIAGAGFYVINMPELVCCVETLEAYGISCAAEYPETKRTIFRRINVKTDVAIPSLNWVPHKHVTTGEHTKVVSRSSIKGRVDIYYGAESGRCCIGGE
jgi:hypothetical protein